MATVYDAPLTTREDWIEACYQKNQSFNSQKLAMISLKHWDRYIESAFAGEPETKVIAYLKSIQNEPDLAIRLNQFVQFMVKNSGLAPKSIRDYFGFIKSWLRANGIRISNDDVRQFVHQPRLIKEAKHAMTVEEIRRLYDKASPNLKALIVTLMSSGMRVSECLQLRVADVDLENGIVRLRAHTTKTREERNAYISKEACDHISNIITKKDKKENDLIFTKEFNSSTLLTIENAFGYARKIAHLEEKYDIVNRYKVNIHGLRAFFHTEATKIVGGDIAHAMIGHHQYLDQYLRVNQEEQKKMYRKIEPYVSLSQEFSLKRKLKNTEQQLKGEKHFEEENNKMRQQLQEQQASIIRLTQTIESFQEKN